MNAVYSLPRRGWSIAQALGQGDARRRRARQQTVQRLRARTGPLTRVLPDAGHGAGRRACSRTAPTRSERSARSTASTSTSACSARSGCGTSIRWSAASAITPIEIAVAREELRLLAGDRGADARHGALLPEEHATPHQLKDAPGGEAYPDQGQGQARRAARSSSPSAARAATRASCPPPAPALDPGGCAGPGYLDCWNNYWAWTKTDEFKQRDAEIVLRRRLPRRTTTSRPTLRVPVTLLETNACSPLATNAICGQHLGQLLLDSPTRSCRRSGTITVHHPFTGEPQRVLQMPAGGRGYTRPPSLISVWSTAPFLLNNSRRAVRPEPVGRGAHAARSRTPSSRCSGPRSATRTPCSATRCRA